MTPCAPGPSCCNRSALSTANPLPGNISQWFLFTSTSCGVSKAPILFPEVVQLTGLWGSREPTGGVCWAGGQVFCPGRLSCHPLVLRRSVLSFFCSWLVLPLHQALVAILQTSRFEYFSARMASKIPLLTSFPPLWAFPHVAHAHIILLSFPEITSSLTFQPNHVRPFSLDQGPSLLVSRRSSCVCTEHTILTYFVVYITLSWLWCDDFGSLRRLLRLVGRGHIWITYFPSG